MKIRQKTIELYKYWHIYAISILLLQMTFSVNNGDKIKQGRRVFVQRCSREQMTFSVYNDDDIKQGR